jgi:DNA/RNA-binding domain of Phe-tRNA-synthetase-like protein
VADLALEDGWVAPGLAEEFPKLAITWCLIERGSGRSPPEVKERLREMSNRYTGGKAVQLRQEPVPWAYRVFFRQVGLDPDEQRTPAEQAALDRMKLGGFKSSNLLDDAMLIATVETGVPLIALDADKLATTPGLRLSKEGEKLGATRPLSDNQIVIADADKPLAILFGEIGEHAGVTPKTERIILNAISVSGVPRVSIEEALWTAAELMNSATGY